MTIDDQELQDRLRPAPTPAPIRPLAQVQRRTAVLRRRRRLTQAGGTAVLTAALAFGVLQAGLPGLGTDRAVPGDPGAYRVGKFKAADAVPLLYEAGREMAGRPSGPAEFFDSSVPCDRAASGGIAYRAEHGVVRDSLLVRGPITDGSGEPPDPASFAKDRRPVSTTVDVAGRRVTLIEWQDPAETTAYWQDAGGGWWLATVQGFGGVSERRAVLTALRPSGRTLDPSTIPDRLDVRPDVLLPDGCRGDLRDLAVVMPYDGWWLTTADTGGPARFDTFLATPGSRVTEVGGHPAVWHVNDTPTPEGGESPSRNLLWRDGAGHDFEIQGDRTLTLERALELARTVHRVTPEVAGLTAADLAAPIRTK